MRTTGPEAAAMAAADLERGLAWRDEAGARLRQAGGALLLALPVLREIRGDHLQRQLFGEELQGARLEDVVATI